MRTVLTALQLQACMAGMGTMALTMMLSDLGNGVTRVSRVALVPMLDSDQAKRAGWLPMVFPLTARVRDAIGLALGVLGLGSLCARCLPDGRCRYVTETDTEYMVWRAQG